jgi:hypothetical protein
MVTFGNAGNSELNIVLYLFEDREEIFLFPFGENRLELGERLVELFLCGLETVISGDEQRGEWWWYSAI